MRYKTIMKIFLATVVSLFTSMSFASELVTLNAKWLHQNESIIAQNLQTRTDVAAMPIINTLGEIWQNRDGALGSEVSPQIANALIYKANNMLAWFQKHPEALKSWAQEIPYSLLTNYSGEPEYSAYLKQLKAQLTSSMSSYNGLFNAEASYILSIISKAQVREID